MPFYTIQTKDIGKPSLRAFGRVWMVVNHFGRILPDDVGKRVYRCGVHGSYYLQLESSDQRARRIELERQRV